MKILIAISVLRLSFGGLGVSSQASWGPLVGPWRPSGVLLKASWGLLGPPGSFIMGLLEIDLTLNIILVEVLGRAVLEPCWGRFLIFLKPFRNYFLGLFGYYRHSKLNMQNRRFISILSTGLDFF